MVAWGPQAWGPQALLLNVGKRREEPRSPARGWVRVMVQFGTSSAFRGWVRVRVRVLGFGFGVRGRKVKSRDCALASDLVKAHV